MADDDEDTCDFIRTALEEAGYEVQTASEGAEALALLRERGADLLITDIFMPEQEGFQVISRCKAEFPHTRIIVISAGAIYGRKHDFLAVAAYLEVGAALRKPFTADQLLEAVRTVLQP